MSVLDKAIKFSAVVIAGLVVTAGVGYYCKKGLFKLPDIDLKDWLKGKENNENVIEISESEVSELFADYNEYVSLIAAEIKMSGLDHDISEIFASYVYLQENGYISFGNEILESDEILELSDNLGINVATGEANARNKIINFNNVLKELGYDSKLVCGELYVAGERNRVVNHSVCFIKEDGHYFLLDVANKTIFFKNGSEFISMKDENVRFKPSLTYDRENGYYPDNKAIYRTMENCYKDCDWFMLDYPFRETQAAEQDGFFKDYEANNLFGLERDIINYLEEFAEIYNSENEEKITLKLESK